MVLEYHLQCHSRPVANFQAPFLINAAQSGFFYLFGCEHCKISLQLRLLDFEFFDHYYKTFHDCLSCNYFCFLHRCVLGHLDHCCLDHLGHLDQCLDHLGHLDHLDLCLLDLLLDRCDLFSFSYLTFKLDSVAKWITINDWFNRNLICHSLFVHHHLSLLTGLEKARKSRDDKSR